jgi:hypothetical protein
MNENKMVWHQVGYAEHYATGKYDVVSSEQDGKACWLLSYEGLVFKVLLVRKSSVRNAALKTAKSLCRKHMLMLDVQHQCEHCERLAPAGKIFCSDACFTCDGASENGCSGICENKG